MSQNPVTVTPILTPHELAALRQLRTLVHVVDKALDQTVLAPPVVATPTPRPTTRPRSRRARVARVVYQVRDRRVRAVAHAGVSDTRVYAILRATKQGLSRHQLLTRLHATSRTGIVDGALRRLRLQKAITVGAWE